MQIECPSCKEILKKQGDKFHCVNCGWLESDGSGGFVPCDAPVIAEPEKKPLESKQDEPTPVEQAETSDKKKNAAEQKQGGSKSYIIVGPLHITFDDE